MPGKHQKNFIVNVDGIVNLLVNLLAPLDIFRGIPTSDAYRLKLRIGGSQILRLRGNNL